MNRPSDSMKHISMLDADQHADTPDDCMPSRMTVTMKAIWMRFDGSMLNVFMISPLHTMALPGRARTLTGKAIPASWIVISSQTKQNWVWYDMFANVHGWIVRPRFRTVCGTMRQSSVRHALKSRVAHGYCIGCAECGRWHVRAGVRYVGMGWCWQHARDEICGATMIAVSSGGTYRTGTCRRHARLHRFTSKLRLISKKMRRCHYCTVFSFFFTRVTQLAKNHSWSAKRNAGNGDLHMVRSCCGNLYENENILSYLYVHIGSNGVIETWVRWILPFGLSKKCKH